MLKLDDKFDAVPLIPSGFNISGVVHTVANTTVTFQWEPPQGEGPQAVVDYYLFSVFPQPLSQPVAANISNIFLSWNVTVEYNTSYFVNITAGNCAGDSETAVLPTIIEFSKSLNCILITVVSLSWYSSQLW